MLKRMLFKHKTGIRPCSLPVLVSHPEPAFGVFPFHFQDPWVSAAAAYFRENTAENVLITAGENCFWIGGITGYAGGFEDEVFGMPVTVFENCSVKNVVITAKSGEGVDQIVGSGFFNADVAEEMGAPFDQPTVYELIDCFAE